MNDAGGRFESVCTTRHFDMGTMHLKELFLWPCTVTLLLLRSITGLPERFGQSW